MAEMRRWMLSGRLMVNDDKTEFLIIGTRYQLEKVNIDHVSVGETRIIPSAAVRDLGVWLDSH